MSIQLFDEIIVSLNFDDENKGRKGTILGISECDDSHDVYAYAVIFHGDDIVTMVPKNNVEPTGVKYKREDFYP